MTAAARSQVIRPHDTAWVLGWSRERERQQNFGGLDQQAYNLHQLPPLRSWGAHVPYLFVGTMVKYPMELPL
jgi:hypothetical protein